MATAPAQSAIPWTEGEDGLKRWLPDRAAAWTGLMHAHSELTRAIDAELATRHGLSLSAYELLARLALDGDACLRISELAERGLLSQSRVSRLVDQLADRGLVRRTSCESDSRVVQVVLTEDGREAFRAAQDAFMGVIRERFFERLTCEDIAALEQIWGKVVDGFAGEACPRG